MEKNIQMSATDNFVTAFDNVMNATKNFVKKPFVAMRNYYSSVIGKEVTPRQAWLITEIQLAFMAVASCLSRCMVHIFSYPHQSKF